MNNNKITNNTYAVIIGLVLSIFWIFMALNIGFPFGALDEICLILTLGGLRHTIMPIVAMILIPICARENKLGILAAIILGITTLALLMIHVIYMLITTIPGFESQLFGPIIWSVFQIPIIFFGYKAYQE